MKNKFITKIIEFIDEQLGNYSLFENREIEIENDTLTVTCVVSEFEVYSAILFVTNDRFCIKTCNGESFEYLDFDYPSEFWRQWCFSALEYVQKFLPKNKNNETLS